MIAVRWRAMEMGDVLTALLARHGLSTSAAPEFSVVLNVSVLCAEERRNISTSQPRVVTVQGRVLGDRASVGCEYRCNGANETEAR